MTTEYRYIEGFGYIPKYWEDNLVTGTDIFGQANAELKKKVKESRKMLEEMKKEK